MRMSLLAAAVGALVLHPGAGAAQTSTATPRFELAAGQWNVDYGRARCSLMRRVAGEGSPILVISTRGGLDYADLMLIRDTPGSLMALPSRTQLVFTPGGTPDEVTVVTFPGRERRAVKFEEVDDDLLDRFGSATSLHVQVRGASLLEIPIPDAASAIAALRACGDDLRRSWGIDVDGQRRLAHMPRHTAGNFRDSDYPTAALDRNQVGTTMVRLTVAPDGSAGDCRLIFSSRSRDLDTTTCRVILERFRYEPARDAEGNPVAAMITQRVQWGIADDGDGAIFNWSAPSLPPMGIAN
jgi:TonB family protein